jgi:glycosyltransferase involved in cell wall biosynthesis
MKVVLSAPNKFHFLDVARQMQRLTILEKFFTGYPKFKMKNEKIDRSLLASYPWMLVPFMALSKYKLLKESISRDFYWSLTEGFDKYTASRMPKCDIFMGLCGSSLRSGKRAKELGAVYVCDRPCSHIRYQNDLVISEYRRQGISWSGVDPRVMALEEAEYALADAIVVASQFSKRSFLEMGFDEKKVYRVPYGVDLSRFNKTGEPAEDRFDVLFAGVAAVRKGIRDLLVAFSNVNHVNKKLTFVGSISPDVAPVIAEFAASQPIECVGHVAQSNLRDLMSNSHVLVLPSIEDGFGLVLGQAMACGCPVIGTTNTGAQDIVTDRVEGYIVPIRSPDALTDRLQTLADNPDVRNKMSNAALVKVQTLGGWSVYGDEMKALFEGLIA